jgi:hypothetical protein
LSATAATPPATSNSRRLIPSPLDTTPIPYAIIER